MSLLTLSVSADACLEAGTVPVCACDDDPPQRAVRAHGYTWLLPSLSMRVDVTLGVVNVKNEDRINAGKEDPCFTVRRIAVGWLWSFSYCRCVFAMLPARSCGGHIAFSHCQHRGLVPPVTLLQILYTRCVVVVMGVGPYESVRTTEEFDHRGSCSLHQRCLTVHR